MRTIGLAGLLLSGLMTWGGAHALEGGVVDSNDAAAFASVGSLARTGGGVFSGVLVTPDYVLTAAHVVFGSSPGSFSFNVNYTGIAAEQRQFAVDAIHVAPGFAGFLTNGEITFGDLALVHLATPVPAAVPILPLADSAIPADALITLVGYGGTGANVKRRGTNLAELLLAPGDGQPAAAFAYDYDTVPPKTVLEATVVGGDSGGAVFVEASGELRLAGISTFSWTSPSEPGVGPVRGGGGMILSAYRPWIDQVTAVPEPASWGLLLAGGAVIVWSARRRRR